MTMQPRKGSVNPLEMDEIQRTEESEENFWKDQCSVAAKHPR